MTDRETAVTQDELHAYVDGELAPERRMAVEAWLARHPDDAARVAEWRAQADAIRVRYGAIVSEPLPASLDVSRIARSARSWRSAAIIIEAAIMKGGRWRPVLPDRSAPA